MLLVFFPAFTGHQARYHQHQNAPPGWFIRAWKMAGALVNPKGITSKLIMTLVCFFVMNAVLGTSSYLSSSQGAQVRHKEGLNYSLWNESTIFSISYFWQRTCQGAKH
jgi:hypothetical protein